jgi:hypothetical protein
VRLGGDQYLRETPDYLYELQDIQKLDTTESIATAYVAKSAQESRIREIPAFGDSNRILHCKNSQWDQVLMGDSIDLVYIILQRSHDKPQYYRRTLNAPDDPHERMV